MSEREDQSALVAGYLDGALDEGQHEVVGRDIESDSSWSREHEAQSAVRARLGRLETPQLSEAARGRFGAALRAHARDAEATSAGGVVIPFESLAPESPLPTSRPSVAEPSVAQDPSVVSEVRRPRWRLLLAAAALVLVGSVAWYLASSGDRSPAIVGEAIAQIEVIERDAQDWDGVSEGQVAAEVASLGWVYHELEDEGQDLTFLGFKKVEVGGTRALTVAYERDDVIVVQLLVNQEVFNGSEEVRDSVWRTGVWSTAVRERTLVGWNDGKHSVVMVGAGASSELVKYRPRECYGYKTSETASNALVAPPNEG